MGYCTSKLHAASRPLTVPAKTCFSFSNVGDEEVVNYENIHFFLKIEMMDSGVSFIPYADIELPQASISLSAHLISPKYGT